MISLAAHKVHALQHVPNPNPNMASAQRWRYKNCDLTQCATRSRGPARRQTDQKLFPLWRVYHADWTRNHDNGTSDAVPVRRTPPRSAASDAVTLAAHLEVVEGVGGRGGAGELRDALREGRGADVDDPDDVALRALEPCSAGPRVRR